MVQQTFPYNHHNFQQFVSKEKFISSLQIQLNIYKHVNTLIGCQDHFGFRQFVKQLEGW